MRRVDFLLEITLALLEKIQRLPPMKRSQVEDYIDFLSSRLDDRTLVQAAAELSERSFAAVWDNEEDAVYDSDTQLANPRR
jgi:hypothetical protein